MKKEIHYWHSPALDIDMPLAVYGHYGVPVLLFPTASADFEEYERFGMVDAIARHIDHGTIKLFSINGVNNLSWYNEGIHPAERARRQALYDQYVMQELVPFIYHHCHGPQPICTVGASMGAYHALNSLLKHPETFKWCIGMSGIYDVRRYFDGHYDDNCYFNNPPDFVAGLEDANLLETIRATSINLVVGQGPWEHVDWTESMARVLWSRGIPCNFDLWGHDVSHDWPWWKVEMDAYIPRLFATP